MDDTELDSSKHCPVCLEDWDQEKHVPKFLLCHHTICISCVATLQETSIASVKPLKKMSPGTCVHCPFCRVRCPVEDPRRLQTNFYINTSHVTAMKRTNSQPRCESVALPECADHELCSVDQRISVFQEELKKLHNETRERSTAHLSRLEENIAVYTWLCAILRQAHTKIYAQLNTQQGLKRRIEKAQEDIMKMTIIDEKITLDNNVEEVMEKLQISLANMRKKVSIFPSHLPDPPLQRSVQVMADHQPPAGYCKTHIIIETSENGVNMRVLGGHSEINSDNKETLQRAASLRIENSQNRKEKQSQLRRSLTFRRKSAKSNKICIKSKKNNTEELHLQFQKSLIDVNDETSRGSGAVDRDESSEQLVSSSEAGRSQWIQPIEILDPAVSRHALTVTEVEDFWLNYPAPGHDLNNVTSRRRRRTQKCIIL